MDYQKDDFITYVFRLSSLKNVVSFQASDFPVSLMLSNFHVSEVLSVYPVSYNFLLVQFRNRYKLQLLFQYTIWGQITCILMSVFH